MYKTSYNKRELKNGKLKIRKQKNLYFLGMGSVISVFAGEIDVGKKREEADYVNWLESFEDIDKLNDLIGQNSDRFYVVGTVKKKKIAKYKTKWIKNNLPNIKEKNILFDKDKSKLYIVSTHLGGALTENDILIDDFKFDLHQWKNRKGSAVLVNNEETKDINFDGLNIDLPEVNNTLELINKIN